MKELIGKRIDSVHIDGSRNYMTFHTDAGPISYYAEGDCCSYSWFEHMDGLQSLIGGKVTEVRVDDGGCDGDNPKHDCLRWDFIKITTDKGRATIEFRNASNGYYSGWAELVQKTPGGMSPLTDDF